MLALKEIHMTYGKGDGAVHALRGVDMEVERGELLAVTGKSGCGKSTLLNILGGVCKPTGGSYFFEGKEVSQFSARQLADFRNQKIGFVVQHFALIQDMTVFQNIALPLRYRGYSRKKIEERVYELLDQFELGEKENTIPPELSGGQCQRTAIARAVAGHPELLLADEPTGALDEETGGKILRIFQKLNQNGMTIIIVTHDGEIAAGCQRRVHMRDGMILNEAR
ncbi:MAG: ABC transporter ATP-binding protein [Candidatus Fimivicinus sp.]|nr:ABC transporter ATP-binding protein [Oscillospiraceae bacterium]MDY5591756.1 ABC transporter ATP-binding protein [Candidatus Fimivicinus sp.]